MSIRKRTWKSNGSEKTAWCVDYVDQSGTRRLKTFALKKDAETWATTARHEVSQGLHAPNTKITIEETVASWIKHCVDEGLERSTIEQRKQHLRLHIAPYLGREKLATLTTPRLNAFLDQLRDGRRSIAMRRHVLTSVRTALAFAKGRGLVAQNVASGIRVKSDDRHAATGPLKAGRDFPSKAELKLLIDRATDRWRPFIVAAIFTGMRASELRGLRWRDVDLDAGTIHVAQRANTWGTMGSPKSAAGRRDIPLVPMAVNALRQWRITCPAGELVFANRRGNVNRHANFLSRVWEPLLRECEIPHYSFHSLRHAAASLFIETLGWSPKRIQTVMGHSSITMTFDRYGHLFADTEGDKEAMKRLEAAIVAA
jgi:integrase